MLKKRQNEVKRNIFLFDEVKKNIARQVLTYNSKNFKWLNRKTRPRMDYEWIEKTILKKSDQKIRKKKSKCRIWTEKPLARYENLIQTKK